MRGGGGYVILWHTKRSALLQEAFYDLHTQHNRISLIEDTLRQDFHCVVRIGLKTRRQHRQNTQQPTNEINQGSGKREREMEEEQRATVYRHVTVDGTQFVNIGGRW